MQTGRERAVSIRMVQTGRGSANIALRSARDAEFPRAVAGARVAGQEDLTCST
ncbi:MAG TPA: hypothetical protein PLW10_09395 [Myxococcota bacterium]|nr:hypothetical protein [Myxococcota bacterium]